MHDDIKGKKALVVILGTHGGGVANTKWLLRRGAIVTVTDMRSEAELAHSIAQFTPGERKRIRLVLGGQHEDDFHTHDIILLGPGVQKNNPWRSLAFTLGKRVENDASMFLRYAKHPVIGITGTRGKSTTTLWVEQLLKKRYPKIRASGNTPENPLLTEIDRTFARSAPHVVEFSSWQLELAPIARQSPRIAVITNLYRDHLNTYAKMEEYADAKANIFSHQRGGDTLILNFDNAWFEYFSKKQRTSKMLAFSLRPLPQGVEGIGVKDGYAELVIGGKPRRLFSVYAFVKKNGEHNLANLLAATLAVYTFDPKIKITIKDCLHLTGPRMREEVIYQSKRLMIVNDSTATTPDGTIAAIKRFQKNGSLTVICGGTDKVLEFEEFAKVIREYVPEKRILLLDGSATTKMLSELARIRYNPKVFQTLDDCVGEAFAISKKSKKTSVILFSPGAASFERFKHEFDRGEQFNLLVQKSLKK